MAITPLMPVYPRCEVRPVRGEGVYLYGEQGEKYLDFASGIAVNLLGHGHPHLDPVQRHAVVDDAAAGLGHAVGRDGVDAADGERAMVTPKPGIARPWRRE